MASLTDFVPPAPTLKTSSIISFDGTGSANYVVYENTSGGDQIVFVDFCYAKETDGTSTLRFKLIAQKDITGTPTDMAVLFSVSIATGDEVQMPVTGPFFEYDGTDGNWEAASTGLSTGGGTAFSGANARILQCPGAPIVLANGDGLFADDRNDETFDVKVLGRVYNM